MSDYQWAMPEDDAEEDDGAHGIPLMPESSWSQVDSLWGGDGANMTAGRWGRFVGGKAMPVGSAAATLASHAGAGGIAAKVGLGAAAGALTAGTGGLAVGVAAGALQVGSMVAAGFAVRSTWNHLDALKEIQVRRYTCTALPGAAAGGKVDHDHIQNSVIQYIINKKSNKLVKKSGTAVGLGALSALYGIGKKIYKKANGTLGKRRNFYAHVVARHMVTHDCKLCEALVNELFSAGDYERLRSMNSTAAGGWVAVKMKST